jgi:hypothetical protein
MQVANRTTRVAPKLDVDKRRARVRKGDGASLEGRESHDGDGTAHEELGHGGGVGLRSVMSSVTICYVLS